MAAPILLALALSADPSLAAPPPSTEPASLALIVASNRGDRSGRMPLRYADDDGAKYYEVFSAIAGPDNTVLLTDFDGDTARLFPALFEKAHSPTRVHLQRAAAELARRSAELRRAGRTVRFHFVFAGHGDVDEGRGFLELSDGPFTADELRSLLRTVDASEAHVILDSCNSFFVVNPRKPGGRRFATPRDAAEALGRRLPNVGVFLSTSAQAEVYEWSELQSGVFSHAVRSGLLGAADANADAHVSYEELAAFVHTAAADIKNPLFRPTVYARGPNGESGRAILDVPSASRTALTVDEAGPVRLAARDANGLRWADAYKEADSVLQLWFPASVAASLEIDRLKVGAEAGEVGASFRMVGAAQVNLSSLAPVASTVAMRGPGDIFRALFSRPFGPRAFAAYVEEREAGASDLAGIEDGPSRGETPESAAGPGRLASGRPSRTLTGVYAVLRPGLVMQWFKASGATRGSRDSANVPGVTLGAGRDFNAMFAAEIEGGYLETATSPWTFAYPSVGYTNDPVPGTSLRFQMAPVALNARLQLPMLAPRPYLLAGAGVAVTHVTIDPPDFNATLRETKYVPFVHTGIGLVFDLDGRIFAGAEGRLIFMREIDVFDSRIRLRSVGATAIVGARL